MKSMGRRIVQDHGHNLNMCTLFAHNSFFTDFLSSRFKLWLDQCNDLSVLFQVIADWEKYLRQRNKRNINR